MKYNLIKENPTIFKKGMTPWNKGLKGYHAKEKHYGFGKHRSDEVKHKISIGRIGIIAWNKNIKVSEDKRIKLQKIGKMGALKRWDGHIKIDIPEPKRRYIKTVGTQLEKKRFRNQRYKAIKRNAKGSHTFMDWESLKQTYKFMCLCCKQQEPEIKLSEDHIVPLSMGGTDYIWNIQPLCVSCNTRKYIKTIDYRNTNDLVMKGGEQILSLIN